MAPDPIVFAEASEPAKRRLQNSGLQLRDQVIAISEDAINSDLKARYDYNLFREKDEGLRIFNHALPALGEITESLSAPCFKLETASNQEVLFFLEFCKGESDFWTEFGPSAIPQKQNIDSWSVYFRTNFSFSKLAEVPPKIKQKIDPAVIRDGTYTVAQLLLNFSAAAIAKINWKDSVCPGLHVNPDLQLASMNMFEEYMKTYMRFMATGPYKKLEFSTTGSGFANSAAGAIWLNN
ncbi:hypothetical protein diail_10902 [Diaporthe ilicicola]|nr:hypothetical protein diail_10902 [Diaporthe ilicicola]